MVYIAMSADRLGFIRRQSSITFPDPDAWGQSQESGGPDSEAEAEERTKNIGGSSATRSNASGRCGLAAPIQPSWRCPPMRSPSTTSERSLVPRSEAQRDVDLRFMYRDCSPGRRLRKGSE